MISILTENWNDFGFILQNSYFTELCSMFASEWHQQTQHELLLSLPDEIQAQKMDAPQSKVK